MVRVNTAARDHRGHCVYVPFPPRGELGPIRIGVRDGTLISTVAVTKKSPTPIAYPAGDALKGVNRALEVSYRIIHTGTGSISGVSPVFFKAVSHKTTQIFQGKLRIAKAGSSLSRAEF